MKISLIGLGKLGLPFAFFLASHGNKILCYDKNKNPLWTDKKNNLETSFINSLLYNLIKILIFFFLINL